MKKMLIDNILKKKKLKFAFYYKTTIKNLLHKFTPNTKIKYYSPNLTRNNKKKWKFPQILWMISALKNNDEILFRILKRNYKKCAKKKININKTIYRQQRRNRVSIKSIRLRAISHLLIKYQQYFAIKSLMDIWQKHIYSFEEKCQKMIFVVKNGKKLYIPTKKTINSSWYSIKKIKQQTKLLKTIERRKLKWMPIFYRNFGFRQNKHRSKRPLWRTKKFKKYKSYEKVLQISRHKKIFKRNDYYTIQACRLRSPSYYRIRQRLSSYWGKNYFSTNFTGEKLGGIIKKCNRTKKKRLIKFVSKIELTLSSLLLRTRLLNTSAIVHQFIKHGKVFVNYNKILSPSYLIQPGDNISIYINPKKQKYHRFHDPIYTSRTEHGLYNKNTARQSLTAQEKQPLFLKLSLNKNFSKKQYDIPSDNVIIPDVKPFNVKNRLKLNRPNMLYDSTKLTSWKFGFISDVISTSYIQQNKYITHLNNILV